MAAKVKEKELDFDESALFAEFDCKNQQRTMTKHCKNVEDTRIQALEQENAFLRSALRKLLLSKPSEEQTSAMPFVQAIFFDNRESRDKRMKIESFLQHLSTLESEKEDEPIAERSEELQASVYELNLFLSERENERERNSKLNGSSDEPHLLKNCDTAIISSVKYFDIFCIDCVGFPLNEFNPRATDGWSIPVYDQVFLKALPCSAETPKVKVKFMKKCFNCDSTTHSLQNCPEPQDTAKINANRSQFTSSQSPVFLPKSRYHGILSSRDFMNFKPGFISDKLREALGIESDQLPPYIYRMRNLGYPPGYLPHNQQPDLLLYDAEGNIDSYTGEDSSDGDMVERKQVFIEYPGLNVPVPEGVKDRQNPPMQPHQQLAYMMQIYQMTMDRGKQHSHYGNIVNPAMKRKRPEPERDEKDMELDHGGAHTLSFEVGTPTEEEPLSKRGRYDNNSEENEGGYSPTHPTLQYGEAEKSLMKQYRHTTLEKHKENSATNSPTPNPPPLPAEAPPKTPLPPPLPTQTPPYTPQQPRTQYAPPVPSETPPRTPAPPPLPKGTPPFAPHQTKTTVGDSGSYFVTPILHGKQRKTRSRRIKEVDLEEGEIDSDEEASGEEEEEDEEEDEEEEGREEKCETGWWLREPLSQCHSKPPKNLSPPPQPRIKLPMEALSRFYTSSTVLQKLSFEDRILWLDPVYGNLQLVSGRYERLKEILRKIPKKSSKR